MRVPPAARTLARPVAPTGGLQAAKRRARKNGCADGWRTQCADCPVYVSDSSCWEQHNGCPHLLLSVHITCDFCIFTSSTGARLPV